MIKPEVMMLAAPWIGDGAILTGSSVAAPLPLANLKKTAVGKPARFLTPNAAFIQADLGSAKAVNLIALIGHTAKEGATAKVYAGNDPNLPLNAEYESDELPMCEGINLSRNSLIRAFDDLTYRYWRIEFSDPASTYIDVGRLYISKVFQPEVNMEYGLQEGVIDPSTVNTTLSGMIVPNERPKRRFSEFTLSFGSKQEMLGNALDIDLTQGTTRDVLFVADYSDKDYLQKRSVYGRMTALNPITHTHFQLFEKTYRIEEIIQ